MTGNNLQRGDVEVETNQTTNENTILKSTTVQGSNGPDFISSQSWRSRVHVVQLHLLYELLRFLLKLPH